MGQEPNPETEAIRRLIDRRLRDRLSAEAVLAHFDEHLDDDSTSAFVEGCLNENESDPLIAHLVQCSACRHTTAQLVRLESELVAETEVTLDESPGRMRSFLENLAARITPSFEEDVVFAYQNPEPDEDPEAVDDKLPAKPKDDS